MTHGPVTHDQVVGLAIYGLRKLRGMTQLQLADELGIAKRTLGSIERAERSITPLQRKAISYALNVPEEWLISPPVPETVEVIGGGEDADRLGDHSGPYLHFETAVFADAEQLELDGNVLELDAHGEVIDAADRFVQAPPPEPEDGAAAAGVAA